MVPNLLQLAHMEEAILICNLSIVKTKITEHRIKLVAIHNVNESKWSTSSHRWCRCGPPVLIILNPNPEYHADPTTKPLYKLMNIHFHTQPLF